jgi:hypothetical protein
MKILLLPLVIAVLSACSATAPPVRLTLGAPTDHKAVSGLVVFPAHITNHSKEPVWFYGNCVPTMPYYSAFTRKSKADRWEELPYSQCGLGATAYEVAPGATKSFQSVAPSDEAGHQYRIELDIYKSPTSPKKMLQVSSEPTLIQ